VDRRNHIFEDPECSAPDEVHPHTHAIKNLGRFLGAVLEEHLEANGPQVWDVTGGSANPFAGDPITKAFVSNGSTSNVATLQLLWLQDATP